MKTTMLKVLKIKEIAPKILKQSLPIRTTYKLSKLLDSVQNESEFYHKHLNEIISTYGKRDENGQYVLTEDKNGIQVDADNLVTVEEKLKELHNLEVELPDVTFTLDELEQLDCTVQEFNSFLPFIED